MQEKHNSYIITPRTVVRIALTIGLTWTVAIAVVVGLSYQSEITGAKEAATIAAREQFTKDIVYRRWNASLGGVYAPVSDAVPPNPYLEGFVQRDLVTESGIELTLINPAYMTRQVHLLALETEGTRGHITSLDPIRPENAPDSWETQALSGFSDAADEAIEVSKVDGESYLRLMKPLLTEESCLTCHAQQGYKVGEVRGGISIAVPMNDYYALARSDFNLTLMKYGVLWLLGITGIGFGAGSVSRRARFQQEAEERVKNLLAEREMMLKEVQHRIKNNMSTMTALLQLKSENIVDKGSREALEDIAERFQVMMRLYDKLYKSPDFHTISLKDFLPPILEELVATSARAGDVKLSHTIEEIVLDANAASTLGIFTAEAVTNSLKHAFPAGATGRITMTPHRHKGQVTLVIRDSGQGSAASARPEGAEGLGYHLMEALAEQLQGRMTINSENGTEVRLSFPVEP